MFKPSRFYLSIRRTLMLASILLMFPVWAQASNVIITTPLGDIELEMLEDDAPITVANFLSYISGGEYDTTFIHRSEPGFILQGGGYTFNSVDGAQEVKTKGTIQNEFKVSNTKGTVAMAKIPNQPNSATSQWFINLVDNSQSLDNQNSGFTVFARVVNGMDVAEAIAELQIISPSQTFQRLPVINYTDGDQITEDNLVMTSLVEVDGPFEMNLGLSDIWYDPATDGQGFSIYVWPTIGKVILSWFTYDTELPAENTPSQLGWAGQRWINALGDINGNTSVMDVDMTSDGIFDTPTTVVHTPNGTITLTFDSCNSGVVEYDLPSINRQGTVPIQRVVGATIELCEELAGIAPATP
jgi:cyclophilin family peptidyl-prolyl cis-trans isomerase